MFNNKRYATRGVMENVNPILQLFLWQLVDSMPLPRDYLQVFKISKEGDQLKITHAGSSCIPTGVSFGCSRFCRQNLCH